LILVYGKSCVEVLLLIEGDDWLSDMMYKYYFYKKVTNHKLKCL